MPDVDVAAAWSALTRVDEWIRHADAKLAGVLAAAVVVGGVLLNELDRLGGGVAQVLAAATAVTVAAAVGCAVVGLLPQLAPATGADGASPLFFRAAAESFDSGTEFAKTLVTLATDPALMADAVGQQVFSSSKIAMRKFRWAQRGLCFLFPSVLLVGAMAAFAG